MGTDQTGGARHACRFCRGVRGRIVLDLHTQPACDHFPAATDPGPDPAYPLQLWLCEDCGLAQLLDDPTVPEEPLATEPAALVRQAEDAIHRVAAAGLLPEGATVAEYGSPHGGSWLPRLAERGLHPVAGGQSAQVVLDCFGLMHHADQAAAVKERVDRLETGGVLLVQFHSLATIVRCGQWNALRHGHYAYYSTPALARMLTVAGLCPRSAWLFDLYGGTVLLAAVKGPAAPDPGLSALLIGESSLGVTDPAVLGGLQRQVTASAQALRGYLVDARAEGRRVLGYGAASRAVALLCAAGVDRELLPAVADASPGKHGRRMPGSGVPVIAPERLIEAAPAEVLLFLPDLLDEVRAAYPEITGWVIAEPEPRPAEPVRREEPPMSAPTDDRPQQAPRPTPALIRKAPAPIAIGFPVRNGKPYLQGALDSLLAQRGADFELHIADNCSDDGTEDICRELASKDERVRYLRRAENVGVTANHNMLVREVHSPYFLWAAADDASHPDRLRLLLEALEGDPFAVLSFSAARQIDRDGQTLEVWRNPCRTNHLDPVVRLTDLIGLEHENYHCYGLMKREVLLRTLLLPPVKNNDRILVAELALHGPFAEVEQDLLFHRLHERRLTQSVSQRDWYRQQRTDGRKLVLPNVEEAGWYLKAVRNSPLRGAEFGRALWALRPWFKANAVPMARNVARAAVDGARMITGPGRPDDR
ncbi:glycosyltransferase [Crossiella sp. SN42]|uniref:glycosyltransferase n=1 Tax=Crossiella sp. SN42 TaxID=2944808 RepID=UPI00207CF7D2|nr:glycosyltransferase [Crossiella sp. SN42]MCO1577753.1 glycosyltransferase [Crossiella sp. SN42]